MHMLIRLHAEFRWSQYQVTYFILLQSCTDHAYLTSNKPHKAAMWIMQTVLNGNSYSCRLHFSPFQSLIRQRHLLGMASWPELHSACSFSWRTYLQVCWPLAVVWSRGARGLQPGVPGAWQLPGQVRLAASGAWQLQPALPAVLQTQARLAHWVLTKIWAWGAQPWGELALKVVDLLAWGARPWQGLQAEPGAPHWACLRLR